MTTKDRDIRDRVEDTVQDADADIEAIVRHLVFHYDLTGDSPTTTFDAIPHDEYWDIVAGHTRG